MARTTPVGEGDDVDEDEDEVQAATMLIISTLAHITTSVGHRRAGKHGETGERRMRGRYAAAMGSCCVRPMSDLGKSRRLP